jgi:MYXO-CTERM domain-containing protein
VTAGTIDLTTCYADSGGPGFFDFGSGPVVTTLNVLHGECAADIRRQRVDKFSNDFVQPFIDYVSGACDASATCGDCDYNGTCSEDCPTRDWDCELGAFTGDGCAKNGDCEEGGNCIPATDDPTFTYCSKGCSTDDPTSCPSTMTCMGDVCVYAGISPGSQGATCSSPIDCRSGFCESLICANACDASDPNSCDTANGFSCLPSEADASATVCRVQSQSGGGGFCAISAPGSSSGRGALAGFGLIFLLGVFLRRRRK